MNISYISMNRLLEERAATDEAFRRQLKRDGKCTLADGRCLSDEALVERLRSLGLTEFDRNWLDRFSRKAPSAQVLANGLTEYGRLDVVAKEVDWVWIVLVCLWERWFPDRPNFEMLDDRIQAGYQSDQRDERIETAQIWLQVWRGVEQLIGDFELESIEEFDECFGGTQGVFNWVQDFSGALNRAALTDLDFARERVDLCRTVLALAERTERDRSLIPVFRRDLAEAHIDLDDYEAVDRLYTQWLRDDPSWGLGWIGWSDVYFNSFTSAGRDAAKAERILNDGLAVSEVSDREQLIKQLALIYEETGRGEKAAALGICRTPSMDSGRGGDHNATEEFVAPDREDELEAILAQLDAEYSGKLPRDAIRAAQRRREEITPGLIDLIRKATETVRGGNTPKGTGHLFALYLVTEFEAQEALPAILEAVSLPGEGPFELFEDAITEDLCRVLAVLAANTPEVIEELIANQSLNQYVRWAAARSYLQGVREGYLTRDQAVERLRSHLRKAMANDDAELAEELVSELVSYSPREALAEIQEAFRLSLVDESIVGRRVERSILEGEAWFQQELQACRPTKVEDTIEELSSWASYREDVTSGGSRTAPASATRPADAPWEAVWKDEQPRQAITTIRNTGAKVGRNERCPCGSGKKYKKCCGAK